MMKGMSVKDIVAQHQRAVTFANKLLADGECLRQSVGAGLDGAL